jgi:hypothetical protein
VSSFTQGYAEGLCVPLQEWVTPPQADPISERHDEPTHVDERRSLPGRDDVEDLPVLDRLALHEIDDLACVDRSEQRLARFVVVERVAAPDVLVPPSRDPDLTWILNRVALRFTGSL